MGFVLASNFLISSWYFIPSSYLTVTRRSYHCDIENEQIKGGKTVTHNEEDDENDGSDSDGGISEINPVNEKGNEQTDSFVNEPNPKKPKLCGKSYPLRNRGVFDS
jgi:hypothetical protein